MPNLLLDKHLLTLIVANDLVERLYVETRGQQVPLAEPSHLDDRNNSGRVAPTLVNLTSVKYDKIQLSGQAER